MAMKAFATLVVLLFAFVAHADVEGHIGGKRTLVLLDSLETKDTHSIFFNGIAARGHHVTFQLASSSDVALYKFAEPVYDNLLLFAPKTTELPSIGVESVSHFVQNGGNLMMAVSADMSDLMREIGGEFGVDFDKKKSVVIDHFSYEPSLDRNHQHTAIITSQAIKNENILGATGGASPIIYRGIGHAVDDDNILALKVLTGGTSIYSAFIGKEISSSLENVGKDTLLVSAIQGRNNARAVISGSIDMFSDEFFNTQLTTTSQAAGNKAFALELSKWALGERGILRASNVTHRRSDGSEAEHLLSAKVKPDQPFSLFPDPELNRESLVYRIKDDIVYSLTIQEYDADQGGWVPYKADDVQMEFVMLDPYVRHFFKHDNNGRFSILFKIPDVYGIFKFRVMYRRPGMTTLALNTPVSIRPFHHDEYERFIFSAYPYYASAFSMMLGFFVFGLAFLYSKDEASKSSSSASAATTSSSARKKVQ